MRPRQLLTAAVLFFCLLSSTIGAQQQVRGSNLLVGQAAANAFLLKKVMPVYSDDVKSMTISGQIVLAITIDKTGKVAHAMVVDKDFWGRKSVNVGDPHLRQASLDEQKSGHPILIQAAKDAVSKWDYQPFLLNGQPTDVETSVTVKFRP
jgi:protein TonB